MMQTCLPIMAPCGRSSSGAEHEMEGDRSSSGAEYKVVGDRSSSGAGHKILTGLFVFTGGRADFCEAVQNADSCEAVQNVVN